MRNIPQLISKELRKEVLAIFRKFESLNMKICDYNNHQIFSLKCLSKDMTAVSLKLNTFNSPNLGNYSPHELVLGRRPKLLLDLETYPDIKVAGMYMDYYTLLNKRIQYLHMLFQDFKPKRLTMLNKHIGGLQNY